jgi:hypothetical protein
LGKPGPATLFPEGSKAAVQRLTARKHRIKMAITVNIIYHSS